MPVSVAAQEWNRFRGPNGSGVAAVGGLPVHFGPERNLVWKVSLPTGYSSPVLAGDRIFLTAERGQRLVTLCVSLDGVVLWEREAPRARTETIDPRNHPASPSPAVGADAVFVFFPEFGLVAYDFDGEERWRLPLGPFNNVYGMGASPIVVDGQVILVCDQSVGSFILSVDADTGGVRWRTARPEAKSGHSTPIVYRPADDAPQVLVPGSFLLTAYSVATGARLWWVRGLSFELKSVPVIGGDTLYINGFGAPDNQPGRQVVVAPFDDVIASEDRDRDGRLSAAEFPDARTRSYQAFIDLDRDELIDRDEWGYFRALSASENGLLAIRLGGRGDVTERNVRWRYHRAVPQLPSPLLYRGILYMVNDGGIVTSLDPETGALLKQGRLRGAIDSYYASPVAADGKVYMVSEQGKVVVLAPDGSLSILAVNDLGEDAYATPALTEGRLYVRTLTALYCFGSEGPDVE